MTNNLNMKKLILSIIFIIIFVLIIYINYNKYEFESFYESGISTSDNNALLTMIRNTINQLPNTFKATADALFNENHTNDNHSHLDNIYIKKENSSKHTHPQYVNPNLTNYLTISKYDSDYEKLSEQVNTNNSLINSNSDIINNIDIKKINEIDKRLTDIETRLKGKGRDQKKFPLYYKNYEYSNHYVKI
jgi:hypothetical protein